MVKKIFPFLVIFSSVIILYNKAFFTYFSQDDFFHFRATMIDGGFAEFLQFFGFPSFEERGYAFYRPIFREVLYFSFYKFFGLNSLPFRILQFMLHFTNVVLVYVFMQKLFAKRLLSLLTSFFFAISAANVGALYYLAGGIQAQGATLFVLASLILFWKGRKLFSFLSFILALASHELAITTPLLLVGIILIKEKNLKKVAIRVIWELLPYFLVSAAFVVINLFVIGLPRNEVQYEPILNPKAITNTLMWYAVWAIGLPEMLVDFVRPGFGLNPDLMKYWGGYFRLIFPTFFISVGILLFMLLKFRDFKKKFLFLLIWFPTALLPVLFLPIHKKTYYLELSLPAFWGSLWYLAFSSFKKYKFLFVILVVSLLTLSIVSVKLGEATYWASLRGKVGQKLIKEILDQYPALPEGAKVYIKNDPSYPFVAPEWGGTSTQAFFVLSGSDALQVLYRDKSLKVYYEDRDKIPGDSVYSFVAKIQ